MKPHLYIRPDDTDQLKIIKALIGSFHDWNNATTSIKQQLALREFKSLFKSADDYVAALYREPIDSGEDNADKPVASPAPDNQEVTDDTEPTVLPAPEDGQRQSPL